MAKAKTAYVCSQCGYDSGKWMGKCPSCGEWNTMEEMVIKPSPRAATRQLKDSPKPVSIAGISPAADDDYRSTGIPELDRVLGGGLVPGGVVLVGGEPGIGKSTLLLQVCDNMAAGGGSILYVSGEESSGQIKMRAQRLGVASASLFILAETDMDAVVEAIESMLPSVVVVDSIQTMYRPELSSAPGSVVQVRESAAQALRIAKDRGISLCMVGHVTKEGALAGPRILEHMVDTVLYFEGERQSSFKILRGVKNRFGSTNEIGVFEMTQKGMEEISNPSQLLVSRRTLGIAGSAVTCSMEGTRPVLCEVQALATATTFGQPRRMATGVDYNRMLLMIAVLEKRAGLKLFDKDIYVNAAGGLRLSEPASDLAVMAAIASAATGRVVREGYAMVGEVGLTGELRHVGHMPRRMGECKKMGFTHLIGPADSKGNADGNPGIVYMGAENIAGALSAALASERAATETRPV